MPQTLYTLKGVNTTYKLRVHKQPGGADSISVDRNPSCEQAIKSFLTWLMGWNVFARVTAYLYPEIAHQLFAYQDQIQSYNQNFPPDTWLKYDNAFWLAQAANKSLSWDCTDALRH